MSRAYASRCPPVPCNRIRSGPDPARSTRVRTPPTSTWRSSWSTSASSPQMPMCAGRSLTMSPRRSGRGLPRRSPGRRSAVARRRGGRASGGVVVVAVPGPGRRVDEVAGGPGGAVVLDLAVALAGDDEVHGLVVLPLHVRAQPRRDRLPEDLEGGGRQLARDGQGGRIVHLVGGQRLQLGGPYDDRARGARPDAGGDPAEELGHGEVGPGLGHQIVSVLPVTAGLA